LLYIKQGIINANNVHENEPIRFINKLNLGINDAKIAVIITIIVLNTKFFKRGILDEVGILRKHYDFSIISMAGIIYRGYEPKRPIE
jgi:hypothetical protein